MKLLITPTSPYARKARIVIIEKNIECEIGRTNPWEDSSAVLEANPIRKVPILNTEHGDLVDSRVICEYLDSLSDSPALMPKDPIARVQMQSQLAIIDGAIDAATALLSMARVAPEIANSDDSKSWQQWQANKIINTLSRFNDAISGTPGDTIDMGDIALGCLLLTLPRVESMHLERGFSVDSDYTNLSLWRNTINKRKSFAETAPLSL